MISNIFARLNGPRGLPPRTGIAILNSKSSTFRGRSTLSWSAGWCNAGDTESCAIAMRIRLQIGPTVSSRSARDKRVCDGRKSSPTRSQNGRRGKTGSRSRQTSNSTADARKCKCTVTPLPAVPIAPKILGTAGIEAGLRDIREGRTTEGKIRIVKAIYEVVSREAGPKNWNDYAKAKPVTDKILAVYSGRQNDFQSVIDGVNEYLRDIVVATLISAQNESQFNQASDAVAKYVTDTGPNSRSPADRLNDVIKAMRSVQIDAKKIAIVKAKCEQAIAAKSK
jgi:hypothetical protein